MLRQPVEQRGTPKSRVRPPKTKSRPVIADLASELKDVCNAWEDLNGELTEVFLSLESVSIDLDRASLLRQACYLLLSGGLSRSFGGKFSKIGVHLWTPSKGSCSFLLIADDGQVGVGEPQGPAVTCAQKILTQAGCQLTFLPSRGVVWRIAIPRINEAEGQSEL